MEYPFPMDHADLHAFNKGEGWVSNNRCADGFWNIMAQDKSCTEGQQGLAPSDLGTFFPIASPTQVRPRQCG
jgi:hypothetical protein